MNEPDPKPALVVLPPPTMVDRSEALETQIQRARRARKDAAVIALLGGQYE